MVPFGGWEMPLEYSGTIDEHLACRSGAVMFDVSHLGTVRLGGLEAFQALQSAFTNDLGKSGPGRDRCRTERHGQGRRAEPVGLGLEHVVATQV